VDVRDYRPHSDGSHSSAESTSLFHSTSSSSSGSTGNTPCFPAVRATLREKRSYAYRSALSSEGYQLSTLVLLQTSTKIPRRVGRSLVDRYC